MAKSKQNVQMPAGIRNKLVAAICMLMVSCIMLVTSTYAWFTLSTAPEVKNIATTVAGNGSLEIALMPENGLLGSITSGFSGTNGGGTVEVTTANNTWGNLVTLTDSSYGLANVNLLPASLNTGGIATNPLVTVEFGADGRPAGTAANTTISRWNSDDSKFTATGYGVRAIGTADSTTYGMTTYGYVVDLAFRLNTTKADGSNGALLLQTEAAQRIYSDGSSADTRGGGSTMTFTAAPGIDLAGLMSCIRVTFVQNYGLSGETATVLGTAKLDVPTIADGQTTATASLYLYNGDTKLEDDSAVILNSLAKSQAAQVSAVVWLDGETLTNADLGAAAQSLTGTLNLQFATDVDLIPSDNTALKGVATN